MTFVSYLMLCMIDYYSNFLEGWAGRYAGSQHERTQCSASRRNVCAGLFVCLSLFPKMRCRFASEDEIDHLAFRALPQTCNHFFFTTSPSQPHQSTQQCCLTLLSHAITSSLLPAIGFCSVSTFSSGAQIITLWLLVTTAPFYFDLCHILEIHLDSHINYYHEKNSRSSWHLLHTYVADRFRRKQTPLHRRSSNLTICNTLTYRSRHIAVECHKPSLDRPTCQ